MDQIPLYTLLIFLLSITHLTQQTHQNPLSLNPLDLQALMDIKNSLTDLPGSHFFATWLFSSPNPCDSFAGVLCSPDPDQTLRISSLTLGTGLADSPGLEGILSPSITNLTSLTQLVVYAGRISGPIPPDIGNLKRLQFISITNNLISGSIPNSLSNLRSLHTVDLGHNQLTGPIPPDLTTLPELKVLILDSNKLSGEITGVLTRVLHLDVSKNSFSGKLPSLPPTIRYLSASENTMWGPLDNLRSLPELGYLDLSMNQFSGGIPESLFIGYQLSSMLLQRNNLSGGLPESIGEGKFLGSTIDLSHNSLSGQVSALLAGAESVYLNNNRFTGTIPVEYVRSVYGGSMKTLYLQHNYITGFPVPAGTPLPESGSLCLSYNCMVPPVGPAACPASAGGQQSRPAYQCTVFNNGTTTTTG